jgi:hypothetical protein
MKDPSRWKNFSPKVSRKTDALAKLLIENGLITREKFLRKISEERATYQRLLKATNSAGFFHGLPNVYVVALKLGNCKREQVCAHDAQTFAKRI